MEITAAQSFRVIYLWVIDAIALRRGTWVIDAGTKLHWHVWEVLGIDKLEKLKVLLQDDND